jgi:hypothetical protein
MQISRETFHTERKKVYEMPFCLLTQIRPLSSRRTKIFLHPMYNVVHEPYTQTSFFRVSSANKYSVFLVSRWKWKARYGVCTCERVSKHVISLSWVTAKESAQNVDKREYVEADILQAITCSNILKSVRVILIEFLKPAPSSTSKSAKRLSSYLVPSLRRCQFQPHGMMFWTGWSVGCLDAKQCLYVCRSL